MMLDRLLSLGFPFFLGSVPNDNLIYHGVYSPLLVFLSVSIAIFAAYAALLVTQHVWDEGIAPLRRRLLIGLGGLCMGAGIWAMHFVGMLAFSLPCVTSYDANLTGLSIIPGLLSSILAMDRISRSRQSLHSMIASGILLGAGIGAMHFSGMAAMRLSGVVRYDPTLFSLSIVVAVIFSVLSLWIRAALESLPGRWSNWSLSIGAAVMGLAVSGMHYTAMASASFLRDDHISVSGTLVATPFLASVVLVITSAIIVMTIISNFLAKPAMSPQAVHYRTLAAIMLIWCAASWLATAGFSRQRLYAAYGQGLETARQRAEAAASNIEYETMVLQGIAAMLAKDPDTASLLRNASFDMSPLPSDLARRKEMLTAIPQFAEMGRSLVGVATSLGADVVYLLNADGICVAASNVGTASSFVGTDYADRDYFRQSKAGRAGLQYAFGRVSKVPGLFLSQPVWQNARLLGAVVVKRNVSGFSRWTHQADAFIADANGVIILSEEPELQGHSLPGIQAKGLSDEAMILQYGQRSFPPANIFPWNDGQLPEVFGIGASEQPLVQYTQAILQGTMSVHALVELSDLNKIEAERLWFFLLTAVAGDMLILAAGAVTLYVWAVRRSREDIAVQARELERSNADMERFTMVLAHHIQEPVRRQHIFAQLLAKSIPEPLSDTTREYLDYITANAARLRNLIGDARRYLSCAHTSYSDVNCDAAVALSKAFVRLKVQFEKAGGRLEVEDLPWVRIGGDPLSDVFFMLLENSITYRRPDRPLLIRIEAKKGESGPVISLADNGIGIPEAFRSKVFMVFERLDVTPHPGTGIGLALVKKSIEAVGGNVWIEDGIDGGTRICLALRKGNWAEVAL